MRFLKRFYRAASRWLRPVLGDGPVIVFHDGFRLNRWRGWFVREGMRGVIIDTHAYLVMSERPEVLFRILPDAAAYALVPAVRGVGRAPHPPCRALYAGHGGVVRGERACGAHGGVRGAR